MSTHKTPARADLSGGLAWVALGAAIVVESLRMERFTSMGAMLYTMPGFMPAMIGVVLMLLGALLALRGWRASRAVVPLAPSPGSGSPHRLLNRRMGATLALTLVYAGLLIGRVPFLLATALFVATFTWHFAEPDVAARKRALSAVLAGLITAVAVVLVFERIFLVRLP